MFSRQFTAFLDLTRRYPAGVISLTLSLPLAVAAGILRVSVIQAELRHDQLNEQAVQMEEAAAGLRNTHAQAATTRAAVQEIDSGTVDEANLAENLWYFYQLEEQTHARISDLHQLNSAAARPDASYKVVPFTLRVAGNYEQVASYLLRLETGHRLARINSYELQRQDSAGNIVMLFLTLDILARP